ncbi:MAG: type II secretion system GspH family protein [Candidatus Cloacimonetes bacterium]|nr:type II secretion system GspH family protein [Candidatus Cloacimonadota bacterium]
MAENNKIEKTKKFSLIELIMVIMLVGIVFTLIIPLREDKLNLKKLEEAVYNMQVIARADVKFKEDPANGYYIFEHTVVKLDEKGEYIGEDLLFIGDELKKTDDKFLFDYAVTDTTVTATSNLNFGKKGASIYYYLPNGPWGVRNDNISESIFDPNWLP